MRKNLFEMGSKLDHDKPWNVEKSPSQKIIKETKARNQHALVFKKEKRRGKIVSLVGEFFLPETEIKALCKALKKQLGTGGTSKEGWMEFQGECQVKLKELLKQQGFRTKK
ncbi:translation initiation factor [Sulfurospirillum sp. 1612]|uniref:translation initiation factor n=1 Tax=Sulfurospirillum sp. 1612 TaxID=3094835 RepID=UPI002F94E1D1